MAMTIRSAATNARCTKPAASIADMTDADRSEPSADPFIAQALVGFMTNEAWDQLLAGVNRRIESMEALPEGDAKTQVFELLQGVDAIHREALRRLIRLFKEGVLEKVVSDPAIHTLMDLYDLLPEEVDAPPPAAAAKHRFPTIPIKAVSATAPARYPHWVPVSAADAAVATGSAHAVVVDDVPVLLARQSERWFALEPRCVQDGSSLDGASLNGFTLTCPNHPGCYYDVRQGKRVGAGDGIACFPVKQEPDGKLLVGLDMDFRPDLPSF